MRRNQTVLLFGLTCGFLLGGGAVAEEKAEEKSAGGRPELVSVEKIWDAGPHNAFTDLVRWRGQFWCTFRESAGHVGGDGQIRVLTSSDGAKWESAALLAEEGVDLRDPKLSVTPDDRLMLTMGGSIYGGTKVLKGRRPRVAFSKDGREWTAPHKVLSEGDWLWRTTWHKGTAYGVAYRTSPRPDQKTTADQAGDWLVSLYKSSDGLDWQRVADLEVPYRPNETTLRFRGEEMIALVRREQGDKHGWIGQAEPPYKDWAWHQTEYRLGGPNFIVLDDGSMWAGTRYYPGGSKAVLARMTDKTLEPVLTLPSGGDTSYPGLVWHDDLLWMSYYSSHEGKSSIYLAKIRLP